MDLGHNCLYISLTNIKFYTLNPNESRMLNIKVIGHLLNDWKLCSISNEILRTVPSRAKNVLYGF